MPDADKIQTSSLEKRKQTSEHFQVVEFENIVTYNVAII